MPNRYPLCVLALAAALLSLSPAPSPAQDHTGAVGYGVGGAWFSAFNRGSEGPRLRLDPGWIVAAHLDQWLAGGRFGGRIAGSYSQRPLEGVSSRPEIDLWTLSAAAMLRLLPALPSRRLAPFVSAGIGVVDYDLGEGPPLLMPDTATIYPGGGETQLGGVLGVGVDFLPRLSWHEVPIGLRMEISDHVTRESPFARLGGSPYGAVHNLVLTLGIHGRR